MARGNRIEAVETSPEGMESSLGYSSSHSLSKSAAHSPSIDSHRRVSIFNPMTKESRPSVIQLSPAEPVPKPISTDAELIPETNASLLGPNITIRPMAEPDPESWKHTLHAICYPLV